MTSTPSRSRASTRISRPGIIGPTSARAVAMVAGGAGAVDFMRLALAVVLLIVCVFIRPADAGDEKTHDRFQPWVLVESLLLASTSANGVGNYDDQQANLSEMIRHARETNRSCRAGSSTNRQSDSPRSKVQSPKSVGSSRRQRA